MIRTLAPWLLGGALALSPAAFAHHSFAMFDNSKTVTIEGTIKELQLVNPHSWLQVMAKDDSGKVVEWSFEAGGPQQLYREGWRKSAIHAGDKITVMMHPLRDGRAGGSLVGAVLADGTHVGSAGTGDPQSSAAPPAGG